MRYYKKDIALKQISSSIEMFFKGKDYISAKTLIHATKVMLEDMERKKGGNTRLEENINKNLSKSEKKELFNTLNSFPNFCKHSKDDKVDYIDTKMDLEKNIEIEILLCIQLFRSVFNDFNIVIHSTYQLYMYCKDDFQYLFIDLTTINPEKGKILDKELEELGIQKNDPYLKIKFSKLIQDIGTLND